jgi:hypothetical protein
LFGGSICHYRSDAQANVEGQSRAAVIAHANQTMRPAVDDAEAEAMLQRMLLANKIMYADGHVHTI